MNQFTQSLRFKLTVLVIAVELLIFSGAGVFYTHRFNQEIDNAIIARLSVPGLLMSRGELSFAAVSDKRTMEGLLREPYSEGLVLGLDGLVYFSSDPALLETRLAELDGQKLPGSDKTLFPAEATDLIAPFRDDSGTYLTCLSPLRLDGKLSGYLYLKVGTEVSEAEKRKIVLLFAIGSLGTIALTALILSLLLHSMVVRRLNDLVDIFRRFARGDYAARAQPSGGNDEIDVLMSGFNGLAKRLEDTLAHLRESETLLNTTQRLSKVGGWEFDVKSGKSFWTEELYRLHEIPNDPAIDHVKESLECYRPEDRQVISDAFQRACEQGEPYDLEFPFTTRKGDHLWIRTTAQPFFEGGKVVRLVGNLMDITERKQAEEALRVSRDEYRRTLDNMMEGCQIISFDWRFLYVNDAVAKHGRRAKEELLGHSMMEMYPGIEQSDMFVVLQRCMDRRIPEHTENEFAYPDGTRSYFQLSVQPVPEGIFILSIDITERKRAEEALRLSTERLQLATRSANIGIWDWDIPRNELVWDDSMYQLYGIRKEDFGGAYDAWISTLHPDDKVRVDGEIQAALRGEREYAPEFRIIRADGVIRHIKADSRTTRDAEGKPKHMIGTNIDITELKQAEMSIRTLNRELEQRVAERTAQLETAISDLENINYSTSHDLRIPLRAVDGFSRLLLDEYSEKLDAEGRRLLHVVRDNTHKMAQYIDDMLTFTRIGRLAMERVPVDLSAMAREIAEELVQASAEHKPVVEIARLPTAYADPIMMRQVMHNLLSNAIKFTRANVAARIEIGAMEAEGETVYFVRDNGVGFDMQFAEKLFGVFQRLHGVDEFEGTGIGLAIVKRIVNRHGGRVWAEGKVGEGAAFYFSLPVNGEGHE